MSSVLKIDDLTKKFSLKGDDIKILDRISFSLKKGDTTVLIGPSGCGKTTLLRILAGFIPKTGGEIKFPLGNKKLGMVFQKSSLYPWKTIEENIRFGLINSSFEGDKKDNLIEKYLDLMNLKKFRKAYPKQVSLGMSQRTSIARAFVNNPEIILMDEPFKGIDLLMKEKLQKFLSKVLKKEKKSVIFVTHDIEEAVYFGDRAIVLTDRPARIKTEFTIDLSRKERDNRTGEKFISIVKEIKDELR